MSRKRGFGDARPVAAECRESDPAASLNLTDLLVFDAQADSIRTVFGRRGSEFSCAPVFDAQEPVAGLAATDLNGDRLVRTVLSLPTSVNLGRIRRQCRWIPYPAYRRR